MRPIREITAEEENFRIERYKDADFGFIKRDPVEPEPVGTVILLPFRIAGYDKDCDGSLMARMENLWLYDGKLEETGWDVSNIGMSSGLVVAEDELIGFLRGSQNSQERRER